MVEDVKGTDKKKAAIGRLALSFNDQLAVTTLAVTTTSVITTGLSCSVM